MPTLQDEIKMYPLSYALQIHAHVKPEHPDVHTIVRRLMSVDERIASHVATDLIGYAAGLNYLHWAWISFSFILTVVADDSLICHMSGDITNINGANKLTIHSDQNDREAVRLNNFQLKGWVISAVREVGGHT